MEVSDITTLLPKLAIAIDTSIAAWEAYLKSISEQPTYESIISNDRKEVTTKTKALQHLLDILPSRYVALVQAYCDDENNPFELSDICVNLLNELQTPETDVDLATWFSKTVTSKKFAKEVLGLEKDIKDEEQGRLQDLRRLKAGHLSLMTVLTDGELGVQEVEALLVAMEEVGVSLAGSGTVNEAVDEVKEDHNDIEMNGR